MKTENIALSSSIVFIQTILTENHIFNKLYVKPYLSFKVILFKDVLYMIILLPIEFPALTKKYDKERLMAINCN